MIRFKNVTLLQNVNFNGTNKKWFTADEGCEIWRDDDGLLWIRQNKYVKCCAGMPFEGAPFDEDAPKKKVAKAAPEPPTAA